MIAVVDYCKGNLKSVQRGLAAVGGEAEIVSDPARIASAQAIVLPGVGAFADASASMLQSGQMEVIRERIAQGVPFLGICLGLHLLFAEGTEGGNPTAPGLGVIPGVVDRMHSHDESGAFYKVPHVGWNTIEPAVGSNWDACRLLAGIPEGEYFYFTHSYIACESECMVATTQHSVAFPSVVQRGNAYGVQFHPEKSSDAGLAVLRNFMSIVKEG
ncbi:imidazole glycerol phosphate synthase subunit HisH [Denitrobacterium detoxificans]|jgi:glutamine amidotransferase|uniref:imidazole glycerol phosphate synthase subunit HisH n=1 Tax=Denitrobacterium detoxificans TaxID=79604 RepID=UPI0026EE1FDE|nr:imidazole glycerol phosphate synthase subunit HisH [Denitrobacterium detoxificans]MBE6466349.1 imidazole glycerol phosphate synthase subunit HisH [Denitrobacterium detoxificans]